MWLVVETAFSGGAKQLHGPFDIEDDAAVAVLRKRAERDGLGTLVSANWRAYDQATDGALDPDAVERLEATEREFGSRAG